MLLASRHRMLRVEVSLLRSATSIPDCASVRHDRRGVLAGAGVAIDVAVEEPRIGGVASLSPCQSMLRGELPMRDDLRVLLARGTADGVCPVEESRSLARILDQAHKPARYSTGRTPSPRRSYARSRRSRLLHDSGHGPRRTG
jgi:hypothetical protein